MAEEVVILAIKVVGTDGVEIEAAIDADGSTLESVITYHVPEGVELPTNPTVRRNTLAHLALAAFMGIDDITAEEAVRRFENR